MDTDPGWTTTGQWAFGAPLGGGGSNGSPDPTSGYTGDNVYGYNLTGDYSNFMSPLSLTPPPLDLTEGSGTRIEFQRWLGVEQPAYDHAYLRVSTDNASWTTTEIDTQGFDYLTIVVALGATDVDLAAAIYRRAVRRLRRISMPASAAR